METFSLEGRPFVALNDLLKLLAWCHSGGSAKQVVADGMVTVDEGVELRKRCKVLSGQVVEFQGQKVLVED